MSQRVGLVNRKGQVTIPASKRKKYRIREGMRVLISDSDDGILITPITPIEDLAGADAGKVGLDRMRKQLDKFRAQDRY